MELEQKYMRHQDIFEHLVKLGIWNNVVYNIILSMLNKYNKHLPLGVNDAVKFGKFEKNQTANHT